MSFRDENLVGAGGGGEARGGSEIIVCVQPFIILKVMSVHTLYLLSVHIKGYLLRVTYEHWGVGSSPSPSHRLYTIAPGAGELPQGLQTGTYFNNFFSSKFFCTEKKS